MENIDLVYELLCDEIRRLRMSGSQPGAISAEDLSALKGERDDLKAGITNAFDLCTEGVKEQKELREQIRELRELEEDRNKHVWKKVGNIDCSVCDKQFFVKEQRMDCQSIVDYGKCMKCMNICDHEIRLPEGGCAGAEELSSTTEYFQCKCGSITVDDGCGTWYKEAVKAGMCAGCRKVKGQVDQ